MSKTSTSLCINASYMGRTMHIKSEYTRKSDAVRGLSRFLKSTGFKLLDGRIYETTFLPDRRVQKMEEIMSISNGILRTKQGYARKEYKVDETLEFTRVLKPYPVKCSELAI